MSAGALSEAHRRMLEVGSGISPDVIAAPGYRTVTDKNKSSGLGFSPAQAAIEHRLHERDDSRQRTRPTRRAAEGTVTQHESYQ